MPFLDMFKKLFKPPAFWQKRNVLVFLLWPLSLLYSLISKFRYKLQIPKKFDSIVICVGSANIGGAGKTPLAIAIGEFLKKTFPRLKVVYACKNYSGSVEGPIVVKAGYKKHGIIDEALLLAKTLPVVVAKNRFAAIKHACSIADVVISDDGFQNNSFHKDISILAVPSDRCFGNGLIFPAGPLRETLKSSLKRADVVFLMDETGESHAKSRAILKSSFYKQAVFNVKYGHEIVKGSKNSKKKSAIAFCGIANPERFFDRLKRLNVIETIAFPDHYVYSEKEIRFLFALAKKFNSDLITTEKDIVKFNAEHQALIMRTRIRANLSKPAEKTIKKMLARIFHKIHRF